MRTRALDGSACPCGQAMTVRLLPIIVARCLTIAMLGGIAAFPALVHAEVPAPATDGFNEDGSNRMHVPGTGADVVVPAGRISITRGAAGGCVDADGDGVFAPPCGLDCDDSDPRNFPGNPENCSDRQDNNCNQLIDCQDQLCLGQACDDGNVCTQGDRCMMTPTGGVGCQGAPVSCDDNNPCTNDQCLPSACIVDDNGAGTATLPPQGCGYVSESDLMILNGLPVGSSIGIGAVHRNFNCPLSGPAVCSFLVPIPGSDCDQAGGSLGGEQECADSLLAMRMMGTGALAGFARNIDLMVSVEEEAAPRTPGDPVQSFNTDTFRFFGQLPIGDPDFDLLRIVAGTDFGLPSPGHTTLTRAGSKWAVDSFFDITYRIDFIGHPGGPLTGMSGSTTGTVRMSIVGNGGCVHQPVSCDDQNPCTLDRCDPVTGACEHLPLTCDDGDQCTQDFCDPAAGGCVFVPNPGAPCNDGDVCTQGDRCVPNAVGGITCQGAPVSCDDQDPCTLDRCNPVTGACEHAPVDCDDQNVCTVDSCDPALGCVHKAVVVSEPSPVDFKSQTQATWPATLDATHWNTYRGTIPSNLMGSRLPGSVYDQTCFESDDGNGDGATLFTDASIPRPGAAFYYLVTGESPCGESLLGHASSGAIRPNTSPCPTPP